MVYLIISEPTKEFRAQHLLHNNNDNNVNVSCRNDAQKECNCLNFSGGSSQSQEHSVPLSRASASMITAKNHRQMRNVHIDSTTIIEQ